MKIIITIELIILGIFLFPQFRYYENEDIWNKPLPQVEAHLPANGEDVASLYRCIAKVAKEQHFKDINLLNQLAYYESIKVCGDNSAKCLNNRNNNPRGSEDRGLFQYSSFWRSDITDACAYDCACSTLHAIEDIRAGHVTRWVAYKYIK